MFLINLFFRASITFLHLSQLRIKYGTMTLLYFRNSVPAFSPIQSLHLAAFMVVR